MEEDQKEQEAEKEAVCTSRMNKRELKAARKENVHPRPVMIQKAKSHEAKLHHVTHDSQMDIPEAFFHCGYSQSNESPELNINVDAIRITRPVAPCPPCCGMHGNKLHPKTLHRLRRQAKDTETTDSKMDADLTLNSSDSLGSKISDDVHPRNPRHSLPKQMSKQHYFQDTLEKAKLLASIFNGVVKTESQFSICKG